MSEQQPKYRVKETYQYCDEMGEIGAKSLKDSEDMEARDMQIGGNHYKDMVIQPTEFIHRNNLSFIQGNVIKYICRYKSKNGIQDLEKAKHYIDLLIQFEYDTKTSD